MIILKVGDIVHVDGKLEGLRGRVVDITYNFKIKLSDYKRVISVADTAVKGELFFAGSHFVTFDSTVLPYSKVISWFKAPDKKDDIYASGNDDFSFNLNDLSTMKISHEIAERGHDYCMESRVRYICLDGAKENRYSKVLLLLPNPNALRKCKRRKKPSESPTRK